MAWQCLLFHHSCLRHTQQLLTVVVHGDGELVKPYKLLLEKGGRIQRAPSYRTVGGGDYAGRNVWGTFKHVKTAAQFIVLCDPDMIFLGDPDFPALAASLADGEIAMDRVAYMTIGTQNRAALEEVCREAWIDFDNFAKQPVYGGVPYIFPVGCRRRLAQEWSALTEDYLTSIRRRDVAPSEVWISVMWALVLAAERAGNSMRITDLCVNNYGNRMLDAIGAGRAMIHYCHSTEGFDKRRYGTEADAMTHVWRAQAAANTVNGAICRALGEAARYYGL